MNTIVLAIALSKIQQAKKELQKENFKTQVEQNRSILTQAGQEKTFYFIPKEDEENSDSYDEYIYVNNLWEKVGSTQIDLSNYYQKQEINELLNIKENVFTEEELRNIVIRMYPEASSIEVDNIINSLLANYSTIIESMISFIVDNQEAELSV